MISWCRNHSGCEELQDIAEPVLSIMDLALLAWGTCPLVRGRLLRYF